MIRKIGLFIRALFVSFVSPDPSFAVSLDESLKGSEPADEETRYCRGLLATARERHSWVIHPASGTWSLHL